MKPRIACTDPAFEYVDSAHTNIAKTFARIRREQRKQAEAAAAERAAAEAESAAKVRVLRSRGLT